MTATPRALDAAGAPSSSAPEIASLLITIQASLSLVAGLSALPFGIVEPGMRVEGLLTILVAAGMFFLARDIRRQRRWARRWVTGLESVSLLVSLLLMMLPLGAMRGPVPVLVNLGLPAMVLWLLWSRSGRAAFRATGSDARRAT